MATPHQPAPSTEQKSTQFQILDARIKWNEGLGNEPDLEVLVTRIPSLAEMRFEEPRKLCYYAEQDGFVTYFCDNPHNRQGYGGSVFELVMKQDGRKVALTGPWSSRASVMNMLGFTPCTEAYMTDRPEDWKKGYVSIAGDVTKEMALAAVKKFCPGIIAEWYAKDLDGEVNLHFRRADNPCIICKGAGKVPEWNDKTRTRQCAHCKGSGHEPKKVA